MLRWIEHEVCNISWKNPNEKGNFNEWFMKINPPMWTAAHFEFMNIPVESNQDDWNKKMFMNKPFAKD